MSKNFEIELFNSKFADKDLLTFYNVNESHENLLDYPVIYLLRDKRSIYVGETSSIRRRMYEHMSDNDKRKFESMDVIYHPEFNKSATYNLETNLIHYISSDSTNLRTTNESQKRIKHTHNYHNKRFFHKEVFEQIWNKLLEKEIVKDTIDVIRDKDIFKLSPFTSLNDEQMDVREKIIEFCIKNKDNEKGAVLLVSGEAGTGKSVLLSSTLKRIMDESADKNSELYNFQNNYLLVHHEEMLKTYEKIARKIPIFRLNKFLKPTTFINRIDKQQEKNLVDNKADVVLVDEAHLLLSRQDRYNNFEFENQLEEIVKRSRITIVIFDPNQVLKAKSYWDKDSFSDIKVGRSFEEYPLKMQMRMNASRATNEWINSFVKKDVREIPIDRGYEIKIFDSADKMHQEIVEKNKTEKLARVVSTFDYLHKKDGKNIYYVEEEGFKLPWNAIYPNTWAEEKSTINEVGSIYTIQGFDLNYVGVILGPSIGYNSETNCLEIDSSKYMDTEAFRNINDIYDHNGNKVDPNKIKEEIILNSINILMKRGIKGLYLYAAEENLRHKLIELQEAKNKLTKN